MWMLSSELAGLRGPDNLSCGKHSPVCHNPFITITDTAAAATIIATIYFILTVRWNTPEICVQFDVFYGFYFV